MMQTLERVWEQEGLEIGHLVLATEAFIVFIDKENDIDWKTNEKHVHKDEASHYRIWNEVSRLEGEPSDYLTKSAHHSFKRMLAEAVARSLHGDYANADIMLAKAADFLAARKIEGIRTLQLIATVGSAGAVSAVALLLLLTATPHKFWYFCSSFGAWGATLSVILRIGNATVPPTVGRMLAFSEGGARILAGAISGIIFPLASKSGFILSNLASGDKPELAMFVLAFAAGASERLVPSLVKNIENQTEEKA